MIRNENYHTEVSRLLFLALKSLPAEFINDAQLTQRLIAIIPGFVPIFDGCPEDTRYLQQRVSKYWLTLQKTKPVFRHTFGFRIPSFEDLMELATGQGLDPHTYIQNYLGNLDVRNGDSTVTVYLALAACYFGGLNAVAPNLRILVARQLRVYVAPLTKGQLVQRIGDFITKFESDLKPFLKAVFSDMVPVKYTSTGSMSQLVKHRIVPNSNISEYTSTFSLSNSDFTLAKVTCSLRWLKDLNFHYVRVGHD